MPSRSLGGKKTVAISQFCQGVKRTANGIYLFIKREAVPTKEYFSVLKRNELSSQKRHRVTLNVYS